MIPPKGPADSESAGPFSMVFGIETEYGFSIEGRTADDQIDDAISLVRGYSDPCFVGWNYAYESPRADLRGFSLDRLTIDPEDAKRDVGRNYGAAHDVRSDRILPNGARFYNDHGHPEYATPECASLSDLVRYDIAGEYVLRKAAFNLQERLDREVRVYKNNTDFHGSSYGTHESYLVPRRLGFNGLLPAILPMLLARQLLTGAGKVGSETREPATYQKSVRADFFTEVASADTLFRRPIFNTRDEPHAAAQEWIRLHVICGDANMNPLCTFRKVGLVKLALELAIAGAAPVWEISDPVREFQRLSRDESGESRIELAGGSWTTAPHVLEAYFAAAEAELDLDEESKAVIKGCRAILDDPASGLATREVDWRSKRSILEMAGAGEPNFWQDEAMKSYDLEYHNIDPDEGLYHGLAAIGEATAYPLESEILPLLQHGPGRTRGWVRGLAVAKFCSELETACWRSLTFRTSKGPVEVELMPEQSYPKELEAVTDVETFISMVRCK